MAETEEEDISEGEKRVILIVTAVVLLVAVGIFISSYLGEEKEPVTRIAGPTKIKKPEVFENVSALIDLSPGENTFLFHSVEGCDAPSVVGGGSDPRCLSFGFRNIYSEITGSLPNISATYKGWYRLETGRGKVWRWMSQSANISLHNPLNVSLDVKINFKASSFYKNRTVKVSLGDELLEELRVIVTPWSEEWAYFLPVIRLSPGENTLMFSVDGCDVPSEVDTSSKDTRCLSIHIYNVTVMYPDDLVEQKILYGNHWWHKEEYEGVRWMSQNATISLYNSWNYAIQAKLGLEVKSFYKYRRLKVFVNDRLADSYNISA